MINICRSSLKGILVLALIFGVNFMLFTQASPANAQVGLDRSLKNQVEDLTARVEALEGEKICDYCPPDTQPVKLTIMAAMVPPQYEIYFCAKAEIQFTALKVRDITDVIKIYRDGVMHEILSFDIQPSQTVEDSTWIFYTALDPTLGEECGGLILPDFDPLMIITETRMLELEDCKSGNVGFKNDLQWTSSCLE